MLQEVGFIPAVLNHWPDADFTLPYLPPLSIFLSAYPVPRQFPVLHWRPVLSQFYPRVPRSNENTRKQRAVNSLHRVQKNYFTFTLTCTDYWSSVAYL